MCAKMIPLIVTTLPALVQALDDGVSVIYVDACLSNIPTDQFDRMFSSLGYRRSLHMVSHGMLYCKQEIMEPEIHDPFHIL